MRRRHMHVERDDEHPRAASTGRENKGCTGTSDSGH
jgi:hypothetical protein